MMALAMTQQQALWDLHRKGRFTPQVKPGTVRMLVKQGLVTGDWYEARLTDSGLQLASELFGSPDPEPTSAPVADDPADTVADETSEPATHVSETVDGKRYAITQNAQGNYNVTQPGNVWTVGTWDEAQVALQEAIEGKPPVAPQPEFYREDNIWQREQETHSDKPIPYKPKDSFTVKARIGSVEYVTATRPLDDDSDPQPVIEWHSIDELPMHRFKNAVQRVTFLTWRDRKPLCDINGYKLPQSRTIAPNFNLGANKVLQGVRLQNMAKGGKKSDTRKAMTARQLGRLLKASPISRKPKPRSPLQIQRDLMFLDWIAGGQSPVQIVSRIETPLTGSVRRIA